MTRRDGSLPCLTVIVPVRDSSSPLRRLLESCSESTVLAEVIVNDDPRSAVSCEDVVAEFSVDLPIVYLQENTGRAQARLVGAQHATTSILIHLDSDMTVAPKLFEECLHLLEDSDAVVIPEVSTAESFWARCKALEKELYDGVDRIEAARCFHAAYYQTIGGHDPEFVFSEDRDLHLRAAARGARFERSTNVIYHHEGALRLRDTVKKKGYYAGTADRYAERHPDDFAWQRNPLHRYAIFVRGWRKWVNRPVVFGGLLIMKTGEYAAAALSLLRPEAIRQRAQSETGSEPP